MKPIKKGMTEAVTRDGRKVTQLTWFDVERGYSCAGVLDGMLHTFTDSGQFSHLGETSKDIFAPVEYEWQWLVKNDDGTFEVSAFRSFDLSISGSRCYNSSGNSAVWHYRIEESKREVKQ